MQEAPHVATDIDSVRLEEAGYPLQDGAAGGGEGGEVSLSAKRRDGLLKAVGDRGTRRTRQALRRGADEQAGKMVALRRKTGQRVQTFQAHVARGHMQRPGVVL